MYRLWERSGLIQNNLLATSTVPMSTGYQFGPDLVGQKDANPQGDAAIKTQSEGRGVETRSQKGFFQLVRSPKSFNRLKISSVPFICFSEILKKSPSVLIKLGFHFLNRKNSTAASPRGTC